jgi:tetratricopeptide (TPR) repeat protein
LHELLQLDRPVAIVGMGGIGKSELALQYAYQQLKPTYPGGVCRLNAREEIGTQLLTFARIYANLEPRQDLEIEEKVRWCWQKWWAATTLIVFDDVQDYGDIQPFLPPLAAQFRVLLTSRSQFSAPVNHPVKILSPASAIELLGSFNPEVKLKIEADLTTAAEICKWLGYLPLGLELVGRYLANDLDLTIAEVWQVLNSEKLRAQALLTAKAGMTAELGVIAAFELSWQKLTESAQFLAARLSLFALAEIPWSLVEQCMADWEPQQLKDLRQSLLGASLLTRTKQGMYELHQLLREFFALKLAAMDKREEFTIKFAEVLTAVAKTIEQTVTREQQTNITESIPHLVAATEFAQYLPDDDKTWCCSGLARFYEATSQFNTVEFWRRKALAISEEQLGANHPSTATSLNNLASLYKSIGKYTEAEPLYVRSLAIDREVYGENHPEIATDLNNLAGLYRSIGRYAEAEPLCVRAVAIVEDKLGTDHPNTKIFRENLQILRQQLAQPQQQPEPPRLNWWQRLRRKFRS